jgi:phosphoribosylformylglycinamidine synthase
MIWRIQIGERKGINDPLGTGICKDIVDLGFPSLERVRVFSVYTLEGELSSQDVERIARELLADPIIQEFSCEAAALPHGDPNEDYRVVEIAYNAGVMDPVEASTLKGIRDLGIIGVRRVRTARQYHLWGRISNKELATIVEKVLSNKLIQHMVSVVREDHLAKDTCRATEERSPQGQKVLTVDLIGASPRHLKKISQKGQLFLNPEEMQAVKDHFTRIGRNPTDCELETIAQTWSEHCYHKTFRGDIRYQCTEEGKTRTTLIRNLLKSTIIKATQQIDKPWCVSVFHDNAGVIAFDRAHHLCFKVETHNHPSALEPYGGANTGVGGVIRDILGTGLGAKPICNTDVFCFAYPDHQSEDLPAGTLHPKRIMKGVVAGVRDYGNKMGIPTINGAILFDDRFIGNPLVYCGCVGLLPKGKEIKKVSAGDLIMVVGGRTGRDGIHGATFSSGELTEESEVVSCGAVQIGDPIQEKKVLDALLKARDEDLYSAITDCGAGGLSSAVGEMGEHTGARVELDKVPLKYAGLKYDEIWISESQERMVLAVSPQNHERLLEIFKGENVEASVIGRFVPTGRLEIFYHGTQVCNLDMAFLHKGIPKIIKEAYWREPRLPEPKVVCADNLTESLLDVLAHANVCSKEWVIRQYDHEVQGGSVVKPLCGREGDGPSDASVIRPQLDSYRGFAVANGINFRFGMIDPYWMAASCIDEAIRQIIAVGGDPQKIALLDNFCWGNPDKPDRLGGLVRAAQACYKLAVAYGTPFISGKDSLYNEFTLGRQSIAIPGTLLISSIGILEDFRRCVTMDFKEPGNLIYVVGKTSDELGGSIYYDTLGHLGCHVPKVNPKVGRMIFANLAQVIKKGWARAVHDCSEGGLGTALAEMAFGGGYGLSVRLDQVPYKGKVKSDDRVLFSESNSRFVVEVPARYQRRFEEQMSGVPYGLVGKVESSSEFVIYGLKQGVVVSAYIEDLKKTWQQTLRW